MPQGLMKVTNMGRPLACYAAKERVFLTGAERGTARA
jgi:hypothetical protein